MALDAIKQTVAGILNSLSASKTLAANELLAESGIAAEVAALAADASADADVGELRKKIAPSISDVEIAAQLIASKTGMALRKNIAIGEERQPEDLELLTIKFNERDGIVKIGDGAESSGSVQSMTANLNRRLAGASKVAGLIIAVDATEASSEWGRGLAESLAQAAKGLHGSPMMDNVHVISSSSEPSMAEKMAARRAAKSTDSLDRPAGPSA